MFVVNRFSLSFLYMLFCVHFDISIYVNDDVVLWWTQAGEQLIRVNQDTRLNFRVIDLRTPANQGIFGTADNVEDVKHFNSISIANVILMSLFLYFFIYCWVMFIIFSGINAYRETCLRNVFCVWCYAESSR